MKVTSLAHLPNLSKLVLSIRYARYCSLFGVGISAIMGSSHLYANTDNLYLESEQPSTEIEALDITTSNIETLNLEENNETIVNTSNNHEIDNPINHAIYNTAIGETVSTKDVTASNTRSVVATPQTPEYSAKTRSSFAPNPKQQASIERLEQYYQPKPRAMLEHTVSTTALNTQPMCEGTWVYPIARPNPQVINHTTMNSEASPEDAQTLYAQSDYGYYDNTKYVELAGNVLVQQGQQQVSADKVVVNLTDGIAVAQGNVLLVDIDKYSVDEQDTTSKKTSSKISVQGGLVTVADEIAYQTNSKKATAKDVAFASVPLQAHGYAKQLNKIDESNYEIQDVMFTTCPPANPAWQINASQIDVNTNSGRGEAYKATLKIKNVPILYLPYFNFPIDDRRTSGVLLPRGGFSSDGGVNVQVPYYFNLAPNYDATVTPTIYSNRNPMLTAEFRYLTQDYGHGDITTSYLPSDKQYNDADRSSVLFNHHWQSREIPHLSVDAIYQYVSDSSYFNDFDDLNMVRSSLNNYLNLPRRIQANYYNDYLSAFAKFETFQTLDSNLSDSQQVLDKDKPYKRLPQISAKYRIPVDMPIEISGVSDFAYFKRPIRDNSAPEQSGGRLYNKITASYPMQRTWGYIKPTVSLQHIYTQYDEETLLSQGISNENKSQSVFVPQFSLDTGLTFYKTGSPFAKFDDTLGGYQLISPRIKYVYSPYKDQRNLPNFNTQIASLTYSQLFEDSWFLGYDRLADNNHFTTALNYRYIDNQGLTRLDASIGQQFYLDNIRVRLDNSDTPLQVDSSGTVLQLSSQPHERFWLDSEMAMSDSGKLGYYNAQLRYQPNARSLYNIGAIKRQADLTGQQQLSALTAAAIFPINDNWRFLGTVEYDRLRNRYSDVLLGFNYESCCYGFTIYGRSYYNELDDTAKPTQAIMAELNLSGITNQRRLSKVIQDRVLGYNQIQRF